MTGETNAPMQPAAGAPSTLQTPPAATTPPQGNQPAVNPAQKMLQDLDVMVPRTVLGKTEYVPVRALIAEGQTFEAGKTMLAEAKALREANSKDRQDAENFRRLQAQLASDPDGAVAGITRLANLAKGVQPRATSPAQRGAVQPDPLDDAPDPNTRGLEQRVAQLEIRDHQTALDREINEVLAGFPALTANEEIRSGVTMLMEAARARNPEAPLHRIAAQFNTGVVKLAGGELTAQRDQRLQRQDENPVVSPGAGSSPPMQVPAVTVASLRDGSWEKNLAAAFEGFRPGMRGS